MSLYVTRGQNIFRIFNVIILTLAGLVCLAPFVNMAAASFSGSAAVTAGKVTFWPVDFTLANYEFAVSNGRFFPALWVSIKRILLGVLLNLVFMTLSAYPLAKRKDQFHARNVYMVIFVITMIIGGGLIPTFILITKLKLLNSLWALVLPGALPVGTMVILMNFIRQMPHEIEEAAMIDGAGVFSRLLRVILPLLKPAFATVGLFCTVGHWNDWLGGIIYMQNPKDYPLQSYLQSLLTTFEEIMRVAGDDYTMMLMMMNARTGRAAQLFLGALPMMLIYPFLQRYFTKGLIVGSVKG